MAGFITYLEEHMSPCFFKSNFGLDCPGCGMQRAFISLLKGNISESIHYNAGLLPLIFVLLFTAAQLIFKFKKGHQVIVGAYIGMVFVFMLNYILKITGVVQGHP